MVTAAAHSVALRGLEGVLVEVEAVVGGGQTKTVMVGLPDAALKESKDRVKAAVTASGWEWPSQQLTVNLSPAGVPKYGTHYDLAVAAAALAANVDVSAAAVAKFVYFGELGLDGRVRRVRGILPALLAAVKEGFDRAVVPACQLREASLVPGITVWPLGHLRELALLLDGQPTFTDEDSQPEPPESPRLDLGDVQGHAAGKWALEVAAAGRHHLYLHGAPGVGKTMLASRLPGILPDLVPEEAIEVSAIHSLAGNDIGGHLLVRPPYSDPHHNATMPSLVGGGTGEIRPGAISLAHCGVLFLDEAPEFGSRLLDALRTPMESGWVSIGRVNQHVRFPANFQLILAANPCPCGKQGVAGRDCTCNPLAVRRYQERLSGPILDRIDIQHHMLPLKRAFLGPELETAESSRTVLQRVLEARDRQARRLGGTPWRTNGDVPGSFLRRRLPLPEGYEQLDRAVARGILSARGIDKVLRLAWTLADLAGNDAVSAANLRVAMQMRQGELGVAA